MPFRDVVNNGKWNKKKYYLIYYCIFLSLIKMLLDKIFISYDSEFFTVGFSLVEAHCG